MVTYTPEKATYLWLAKYSGDSSDSNLDNTSDNYKVTNWKVFNINEDGTVDLIATQPTTGTVNLGFAQGYNNGVKLLNDACNTLYGNSTKGISGRNINIKDIEEKMTEEALKGTNGALNYTNGVGDAIKYNEQVSSAYTTFKNYPSIYAKENLSVINGNKKTDGLKMSEQASFVEKTEGGATDGIITNATSIQPYQTYWEKDNSFMQSAFQGDGTSTSNVNYNLIMPNGTSTTYWVATRCINTYGNNYSFLIRDINSGVIYSHPMFRGEGTLVVKSLAFRPIISLNYWILKGSHTEGWRVE